MLKFQISNQHINRVDNFEPVSDTVGYLKASFEFLTEDWNDTTKTVIFRTTNGSYPIILDESNICEVDCRALVKGSDFFVSIGVSVFGVKSKDYRITTTEKIVKVLSSGYGESEEMPEPPEDIYAQILAKYGEVVGIATDIKNKADNGEFNGTNGKDGDDGRGIESMAYYDTMTDGQVGIYVWYTDGTTDQIWIPGLHGKDGETPEKGVDYWTEEDKAEIKSYVDEAILGGAW